MNIWKANKIPLGMSCSAMKGGIVRKRGNRGGMAGEESSFRGSVLTAEEGETS